MSRDDECDAQVGLLIRRGRPACPNTWEAPLPRPASPSARPASGRTPPSGRGLTSLRPGSASGPRRASGHSALLGRPGQVAHSPATRPSRGGAATGVATPSVGNARPTEGLGGRRRAVHGPAHSRQAPPRPAGPAHRGAGLNKCTAPTREPGTCRFRRSGPPPELRSWGSCSLGAPQPSQGPHPRDGGAGLGTGGGEAASPAEALDGVRDPFFSLTQRLPRRLQGSTGQMPPVGEAWGPL